jgi:thiamine monophosphate kinase
MPTESSNKLLQDPDFPKKLEAVLKQIKAEAAYFTPIEGERGGYIVVNLSSSDIIATITEPLWMMLNCKLDFQPVMELKDLQQAVSQLQKK